MAPSPHVHHVCHLYECEERFLDSLAAFVGTGLRQRESVIVVATPSHLAALQPRLRRIGHDVGHALACDRLVVADAHEELARILRDGAPEAEAFEHAMGRLVARARRGGRGVRAFGEMVALLWAEGRYGAAVALERLWNGYLAAHQFPLLCAYPRQGFMGADRSTRDSVVAEHARLLAA